MTDSKPAATPSIDVGDLFRRATKYLLEGLAVAIAAYFIPSHGKMSFSEIIQITLVAVATFIVLDYGSPSIGASARTGAGFGIGAGLVGFP